MHAHCNARREGTFNQTLATRPQGNIVQWPMAANFAVGALP